jgi:hypothetical protein
MPSQAARAGGGKSGPPESAGIGGWLILPFLGIALTLLSGSRFLASSFAEAVGQAPVLAVGQQAFVGFALLANTVLLAALPAILLVLFFLKRRAFVRWYVAWGLLSLVFVPLYAVLAGFFLFERFPMPGWFLGRDNVLPFMRVLIFIAVWIPYMLRSRRVANTFVT